MEFDLGMETSFPLPGDILNPLHCDSSFHVNATPSPILLDLQADQGALNLLDGSFTKTSSTRRVSL